MPFFCLFETCCFLLLLSMYGDTTNFLFRKFPTNVSKNIEIFPNSESQNPLHEENFKPEHKLKGKIFVFISPKLKEL